MPNVDGRATRGLCVVLAAAVGLWSLPAVAMDKEACVGAAERAQRLHKAHKLLASREQLLLCSSPDCPSIVSSDCTNWLGEVQRSLASVVVRPRDGRGRPLATVRVSLDGVEVAALASGSAVEIDPGSHVFRCEHADATPVEVRVTMAEGERGREVTCDMPSAIEATAAPNPGSTSALPGATSSAQPLPTPSGGVPWPSWALGGLGVVALASTAFFGVSELNQQNADAASGGCKPNCSGPELGSIQTKIDISYVSAAVAVVALGAAVVVALLRSSDGAAGAVRAAWRTAQFPQVLPASP